MEHDFLRTVREVAATFFRSRIEGRFSSGGAFALDDISVLRDSSFSVFEVGAMGCFLRRYFAEVNSRVASSSHLLDGEIVIFSGDEAGRFVRSFFTATVTRVRECLALTWSLEASRALDEVLGASDRARAADRAAARAAAAAAAAARIHARAAAPTSGTEPGPSRARSRAAVHSANYRARRAAAAAAAAAAVAPAFSEATLSTSLPPLLDPELVGYVGLFGFVVSSEFSEVVSSLMSEVSTFTRTSICTYMSREASRTLYGLSHSERHAWFLKNRRLCEAKCMARCVAEYCYRLLPVFITNHLCSIRVWDSSVRCLLPLTGNKLVDFWSSLDRAIL
ncbi:hypothetical protein, partial [Candidatus Ichthyocystis sparus]